MLKGEIMNRRDFVKASLAAGISVIIPVAFPMPEHFPRGQQPTFVFYDELAWFPPTNEKEKTNDELN
jgi:hypothetical protein